MAEPILTAKNIVKSFSDPIEFEVLHSVNLEIQKGEFTAIVGKSGCGKSTLLYILSTMDTDYKGSLSIDGERMTGLKEKELARVRNEKIGFVFQFHYLLNEFTVLKNVMLPALKLNKFPLAEIEAKAMQKLQVLGMEDLAHKPAFQLSGGQKQRVAIARSLINDPIIIMADEPTGNLDSKNSQVVFDTFMELSVKFNQTLLVVTHDNSFAQSTGRIIEMDDGRIVNETKNLPLQ
jgi:lipoprotein-releasing system ATP-binding protein